MANVWRAVLQRLLRLKSRSNSHTVLLTQHEQCLICDPLTDDFDSESCRGSQNSLSGISSMGIARGDEIAEMAESRSRCAKSERAIEGYIPVILDGKHRAFVKISELTHPGVVSLLNGTAIEQGFSYSGPLRLFCDPESFSSLLCRRIPSRA
ncbi:hypothetical protein KP509_23G036500 [Ceratopteris richardii]|uniref:Uncharacterized protein n=1 Tax=Ceratopteris richardii TaxID=49495 RepID=A0A8T2S1X6_CERRI|nr:hypothetical protein KP509_23G036500 [Ceratopteris richardii]